ncbi:membrane protein [Microbacterium mangrovi]|uniref:Membrane protein n=1 Tax=Microbacterium mangrovi TaxID=1348253 RepID=A0A0B2A4N5_9MICO|nr:DUF1206 domain-containing protein [Microbacterium mangrovi]KHK98020.1 membrane protein [Microbacterium mangrovi]
MSAPKSLARAAENSTVLRGLARAGYIVLGVVHVVIGLVAISIVTGGGGTADQSGAMAQIRKTPIGLLLLWLIVLGLLALAIWQIVEAVVERGPDPRKRWGYRAKFIGTAVAYLAIAWTALVYALGGQSNSVQSSEAFTAKLLARPGGVILVALLGLVISAIGVAFIVRGFTRAFTKHLDLPSGVARPGIVTFGVVGYVAKGIAVGVAGILFVVAAFTHDPHKAGGLDGALHTLATLPFGAVILWVVGAGLVIYGVFCFARARYARM